MGLNLDPGGGGLLDSYSVTGCAFFLDLGSEMTWLASSMGTMYRGLRFLTLFAMVLKEVDFWPFSPMVLKEVSFLDPSSMVLKEPFLCMFWDSMVLEEPDLGQFLAHLVDGLERTLLPDFWWMVLKESLLGHLWLFSLSPWWFSEWSWKECTDDSDLLLWHFHGVLPSILSQWSWKEFLVLFSDVFSIAKTNLEIFLHNTHMRPNLMLAGCPTMIGFVVLVSTM